MLRDGRFNEAVNMGVQNLQDVAAGSGDTHKHDLGILQMLQYAATIDS
jgi:hypothetical protein